MSDQVFTCPYALNYTEGRDLQGHNLGLVRPGDIRDLDQAPDQWWRDATGEDRAALAARDAAEAEPGQPGTEAEAESGQQDAGDQGAGDAGGAGETGTGTPPDGSDGSTGTAEQNEPGE